MVFIGTEMWVAEVSEWFTAFHLVAFCIWFFYGEQILILKCVF